MSLEDERVRFYFKHREQIEQWAALRAEAAASVDEWMLTLGADVDALAKTLGADVRALAVVGAEAPYPSYRLVRASWGFGETSDPPACVSLEWLRGRTTMNGTSTPYVGLRSPKTSPIWAALRSSDAARQARVALKHTSSAWWLGYDFVRPPHDFPSVTESYRESLLQALRASWLAYEPHVTAETRALG